MTRVVAVVLAVEETVLVQPANNAAPPPAMRVRRESWATYEVSFTVTQFRVNCVTASGTSERASA